MAIDEDPEGHEVAALGAVVSFAGRRVVEIGCGEGRLTARYASAARSVIAIDPDTDAIEAFAAAPIPNVDFRALAVEQLDLAPHSADVVLFAWSL
jgi:2-polyprenyl-3-methyl-5-hydroxy-6-metoxy-1,4-benzoquinol methylase